MSSLRDFFSGLKLYLYLILVILALLAIPTKDTTTTIGTYLYWGTIQTDRGTDLYMLIELQNGKKIKVDATRKELSFFKKGKVVDIVVRKPYIGFNDYSIKSSLTNKAKRRAITASEYEQFKVVDSKNYNSSYLVIIFKCLLLLLLWMNISASIVLYYDDFSSAFQKRAQLILIWLTPYFGAYFILAMFYEIYPKARPKYFIPFNLNKLISCR